MVTMQLLVIAAGANGEQILTAPAKGGCGIGVGVGAVASCQLGKGGLFLLDFEHFDGHLSRREGELRSRDCTVHFNGRRSDFANGFEARTWRELFFLFCFGKNSG